MEVRYWTWRKHFSSLFTYIHWSCFFIALDAWIHTLLHISGSSGCNWWSSRRTRVVIPVCPYRIPKYQRIDLDILNNARPRKTPSKGWNILASIDTYRPHSFSLLTHECKLFLRLRVVDLLRIKFVYFVIKYCSPTITLKLHSLGPLDHTCPLCRSPHIFINIPLLQSRYHLFDFLICIFHPCN